METLLLLCQAQAKRNKCSCIETGQEITVVVGERQAEMAVMEEVKSYEQEIFSDGSYDRVMREKEGGKERKEEEEEEKIELEG